MTELTSAIEPIPVAVFISGNGSNLQALIDYEATTHACPYEIVVVVSNKANAFGLERAKKANIPTCIVDHKSFDTREAFEKRIMDHLAGYKVEVIALAGFMRVLSPFFVNAHAHRILNLHPSLLPLFPGLHAVEQALEAKVSESGCTVHIVDTGVDTGPIVAQARIPVQDDDNADTLHERIHRAEHELYPTALSSFCFNLIQDD